MAFTNDSLNTGTALFSSFFVRLSGISAFGWTRLLLRREKVRIQTGGEDVGDLCRLLGDQILPEVIQCFLGPLFIVIITRNRAHCGLNGVVKGIFLASLNVQLVCNESGTKAFFFDVLIAEHEFTEEKKAEKQAWG